MKINYRVGIYLLVAMVLISTSCAKRVPEPEVSRTGVPIGLAIALPSEMKNAESDSAVLKEAAVVISVPDNAEFYVGSELFSKQRGEAEIFRLLDGQQAAGKPVYVAASFAVNYLTVVQILYTVRRQGVNSVGLLVEQQPGKDGPAAFKVQIAPEPAIDEVLPVKPAPLTLVVSVGADEQVKLNKEPVGTAKLTEMLTQVFQQRQGNERAVIIQGRRSTNFGQVVRLIDAARGAGASPIVLRIDGLDE